MKITGLAGQPRRQASETLKTGGEGVEAVLFEECWSKRPERPLRWWRFAQAPVPAGSGRTEELEAVLDGLAERELVRRLERRPEQKEQRYRHLLDGEEDAAEAPAP